ncbi:hypothetical protein T265_12087 [Opisthorchis viverrini]|uniref:Uncharacterized protein n=1 Tax=Opisthorchis viverrini TaxID=6198 RepID=A0A074Z6T0_OPIVI|nr:hypothetical protein T265_12087 [Opisthorchis viverrini]KER18945.1 hypothetical protein T265_12087 [Opisthorchis viverrini]
MVIHKDRTQYLTLTNELDFLDWLKDAKPNQLKAVSHYPFPSWPDVTLKAALKANSQNNLAALVDVEKPLRQFEFVQQDQQKTR